MAVTPEMSLSQLKGSTVKKTVLKNIYLGQGLACILFRRSCERTNHVEAVSLPEGAKEAAPVSN